MISDITLVYKNGEIKKYRQRCCMFLKAVETSKLKELEGKILYNVTDSESWCKLITQAGFPVDLVGNRFIISKAKNPYQLFVCWALARSFCNTPFVNEALTLRKTKRWSALTCLKVTAIRTENRSFILRPYVKHQTKVEYLKELQTTKSMQFAHVGQDRDLLLKIGSDNFRGCNTPEEIYKRMKSWK